MTSRIIGLLFIELVCVYFLVALIKTPFTMQSVMAGSRYHQQPTPENERLYEEAKTRDQRQLMTQRIFFGMALVLNTSLLWRAVKKRRQASMTNQEPNKITGANHGQQ